jgi:hypothetical protein
MAKSSSGDQANRDDAKRDEILKRMLKTPPKPHNQKPVKNKAKTRKPVRRENRAG